MKSEILHRPCVPLAYILQTLEQAAERGVRREQVIEGLGISPGALEQSDARFSLLHYTQIMYRSMKLSGDFSFGYEFGLRLKLTAHGFVGLGLMSLPTLRDAVEFGIKNIQLLTPCYSLRLFVEGKQAVIDMREAIPFGPLRKYGFDMLLVAFARAGQQLMAALKPVVEISFDYPEPEYYARYRERLPPVRFSAGANQLRFPAEFLDLPLNTANRVTAKLMGDQCEREMSMLGHTKDFLARVRATLVIRKRGGYPALETVSSRLFMSSRTLKRRLREHGVSFQKLLDETRLGDSRRLLENPTLSIEDIAARVGYSEPANFTRAFRKWTGSAPSSYRAQALRSASRV